MALPVTLSDSSVDVDRAWELARRHDQHPIYDMIYVAPAERTDSLLITGEGRLRRRRGRLPFVIGPEEFRSS